MRLVRRNFSRVPVFYGQGHLVESRGQRERQLGWEEMERIQRIFHRRNFQVLLYSIYFDMIRVPDNCRRNVFTALSITAPASAVGKKLEVHIRSIALFASAKVIKTKIEWKLVLFEVIPIRRW